MILKLMPHQEQVLDNTANFDHVAYYLDMGLGKTFVGAEKLWELNNAVNLVICQKSKVQDWIEHFIKYYPEYHVHDLTKKKESTVFMNEVESLSFYDDRPDVIGVINYDICFRRDWLKKLQNFTLLLDESSLISNENTKRAKAVLKMNPESVILLSGTPTAGKYEKLWSQLKLLGWNIDKDTYWKSYVDTEWIEDGDFYRQVILGYKNTDHLKKRLAQHGAVFMKTEEVMNLPEQVEQFIMLNPTKQYRSFCKKDYLMMPDGTELVGDNSLTKILHQRQLCGQYHADKLQAFRDLIDSTNDRLIVFYNFNAELDAMWQIAKEADRPRSVLNGNEKHLDEYNDFDDSITFIQYQAGAMGGNFQKANRIIYFTLPLGKGSCDLWEQSKKRIHRIGQERTCFYYYLLVKNSIETLNLESLRIGKDLTNELFQKH